MSDTSCPLDNESHCSACPVEPIPIVVAVFSPVHVHVNPPVGHCYKCPTGLPVFRPFPFSTIEFILQCKSTVIFILSFL